MDKAVHLICIPQNLLVLKKIPSIYCIPIVLSSLTKVE